METGDPPTTQTILHPKYCTVINLGRGPEYCYGKYDSHGHGRGSGNGGESETTKGSRRRRWRGWGGGWHWGVRV